MMVDAVTGDSIQDSCDALTPEVDLLKLNVAEKDDLILRLLPLIGQLEAALARIAELEKRLAAFERPPKTPGQFVAAALEGSEARSSQR